MVASYGYAVKEAKVPLVPFKFERREPRDADVVIEITHCGVCHSDIHQVREEWGPAIFLQRWSRAVLPKRHDWDLQQL